MSSFAANLVVIFAAASCLMTQVENKSVFGIGTRIIGDQLLMKDALKTPPISLTEDPFIQFNYAISQPITYIEILSEKDIYASIDFSYENELVHGTIQETKHGFARKPGPFEVLIQIYGLNDTVLNVNPAYILNKDQQFNGILRPKNDGQPHESLSLMNDDSAVLEHLDDDYDENVELDVDNDDDIDHHGDNYDEDNGDYDDYDDRTFNTKLNKVIELGKRQTGDYMVYETYQTSADATETPTNHTVTFYYIDSDFISFVKFTIYDHFLDNPLANYKSPTVQFEKISPHTLKAIVTDQHTTSLFVQMQIYGYKPNDKPVAYESYLTHSQSQSQPTASSVPNGDDGEGGAADYVTVELALPMHRRIQIHFNAEDQQQQQHKQQRQPAQQPDGASNGSNGYLAMFNWLLHTSTTMALVVVSRQMVD